MHVGSIDSDLTAAGRVYSYLRRYREWVGSWTLTYDTHTTAISTRISEIRYQLAQRVPPDEEIEVKQVGHLFYYRLVSVPVSEQLALGV